MWIAIENVIPENLGIAVGILFSPLGKLAGRAIYFSCVNFFFSFFFYYEQSYLSIYWTDLRSFHQMEGIYVDFLDPVQFFRFLKGCCHGNQFCVVEKRKPRAIFAIFTPYESLLGAYDRSEILFQISRDVAMATNLMAKMGQNYLSPCTCRSINPKRKGISRPQCAR